VHGHDGTDIMWRSDAAPELVAKRYPRLVIGSGDGVFAVRARAVRNLGVGVLIIVRPRSLSAGLRKLGCAVLAFDDGFEPCVSASAHREFRPPREFGSAVRARIPWAGRRRRAERPGGPSFSNGSSGAADADAPGGWEVVSSSKPGP